MLLYRWRIVLLISLSVFLISCTGNDNQDETPDESNVEDEQMEEMSAASNALGFSTLTELHENKGKKDNIFVSPTSLYSALLLAYNGASEETKEDFSELLDIKEWTDEEVNEAMYVLSNRLGKDKDDIEVTVANSLWLDDTYTFQADYKESMETYFDAHMEAVDKTDDASVDKINKWVQNQTDDKIEEIMEPPLQSNFVALLVNVLYFNGNWQFEFPEESTKEDTFFASDKEIEVPFMQLEEELDYMENDNVEAVQLPYGEGEMMMEVYVPKEDEDMSDFLTTTLPEQRENWKNAFKKETGTVHMPKFELEYDIVLNDVLQELGLKHAFSDQADFSSLVEESDALRISEVKQKTFLDVNEKGTEAAAATSVEIEKTSLMIGEEFDMQIDRPFVFTITDTETDAILFLGKIEEPPES